MFDISWTEFMLIGVVALIVIGPKELPGVLRTLGQYTRKVRSMAADFQNQFQEAMREAEMADLKKQVDDMAQDIKDFDPLKGVREDVEAAGKDIERSFKSPLDDKPAPPAAGEPVAADAAANPPVAAAAEVAAAPAAEAAAPVASVERSELETVGAAAPRPEPAADAVPTDGSGHSA
jgi:sec-independent protein translocase protein TatB